jgi:hypothetical protein
MMRRGEAEMYGEGHVFLFSSGNVFSHCVSNVQGEGPGLML